MDKLQRLLGEMCLLSDACTNCVTGLITRSQIGCNTVLVHEEFPPERPSSLFSLHI